MTAARFAEVLPPRPAWLPRWWPWASLETQVTNADVRVRFTRGTWRVFPLSRIERIERASSLAVTFPAGLRQNLRDEVYLSVTSDGVRLTLRGGDRVCIASRRADEFLRVLRKGS